MFIESFFLSRVKALSFVVLRSALRPCSEAEWGLLGAVGVIQTATFSPHSYHTKRLPNFAASSVRSSELLGIIR